VLLLAFTPDETETNQLLKDVVYTTALTLLFTHNAATIVESLMVCSPPGAWLVKAPIVSYTMI
jgi:hypothetical protein